MADYTHLYNLVWGEVYRIKERRPPSQQGAELAALSNWLKKQSLAIAVESISEPEPTHQTANESAVEHE
jgi:hypothetical protein